MKPLKWKLMDKTEFGQNKIEFEREIIFIGSY